MLPQKPPASGHKLTIRRWFTYASLPLVGIVTAFGFMPQAGGNSTKPHMVVEEISLPDSIPPTPVSSSIWRSENIQPGETVSALLHRLNVDDNNALVFLSTDRTTESFRKLATGKSVQAEIANDGTLLGIRYIDDTGIQMLIEKTGSQLTAHQLPSKLEQRIFMRSGEIKTTLFAATDEANLPDPAANQLAEIFGSELDFHEDLRPGDRFTVIYEMTYNNGEPVRAGRVLAAEVINRGKTYRSLYFQTDSEHGDYYSPEGHSMHKTFLRSPMEFSRISSGYTAARFHPILHKWRAHRGVDFAAPVGTKVKVTASGDVVFAGRQPGYGNMIIIKHQGRYSTVYGHLSRFARGLRVGQHVLQGEIIGYVGKSGWATGPHLHYEFRVDGRQRNPLNVALPNSSPIHDEQRVAFQNATRELNARLNMLRETTLAQMD